MKTRESIIYKAILVVDPFGGRSTAIVEDLSETIQLSGVIEADSERRYYEGEAWGAEGWAKMHGFNHYVKVGTVNIDYEVPENGIKDEKNK